MEEFRLGYNNLHVIPSPSQNLPQDYVTVHYTCPCCKITSRFALHRLLLYHLMGRTGGMECDSRAHPYLQMLIALQSDAILAARSKMNIDEESPDR